MTATAGSRPCTNCGRALSLPLTPFCPHCGQETHVRAPRLMEFLQQFGGAYLSTEGALWRTLALLFFKPGELTRRYLAGQRKHFVLPLRLYLTISLVVLLALRVVASFGMDEAVVVDLHEARSASGEFEVNLLRLSEDVAAGIKNGVFFCRGLPRWICHRLERRSATNEAELRTLLAGIGERSLSHAGLAMFLLLPSFALWLKIVYWNRRLHYTEHLVFALHVHAFWFAMLALLLLNLSWLSAAAMLAVPVYTVIALRRVYGGAWRWLLLRTLTVVTLQTVALVTAVLGLVIGALLA